MSNLKKDSVLNEDLPNEEFLHYIAWFEIAQKTGDQAECRGRAEAIIQWLEQEKQLVPAEKLPRIDVAIGQLASLVSSMPKPSQVPDLPGMLSFPASNIEELKRTEGAAAVIKIESMISQLPAKDGDSISYCLEASRGLPAPGTGLDCHHIFALTYRSLWIAVEAKDEGALSEAILKLEAWANQTKLNPGFDREELLTRLVAIVGG